jgi:hypothetical protein
MNLHLAEIARNVAPGAHAVLLLDQAGLHMTDKLDLPADITIVLLPPKCPELIWGYARGKASSGRHSKSILNIL